MTTTRVSYNFAVVRVVPHVHLGAFTNVGVLLHSRTAGYLGMRAIMAAAELGALVPDVDSALLARYLQTMDAICRGDAAAGPIALLPPSERFHWLSAPRSDVLQCSPVHEGLCNDPAQALEALFAELVHRCGLEGTAR
jgi:hypothetical protein